MIRVADYIFEKIAEHGVDHVFMVTGRGALFLSDAVARHSQLQGISMHHEQSAAYAAVAYAQSNEKLGACLVSTGCAATNAITGALNAWQDGIPCVFVSGQNTLNETSRFSGVPLRTFGQQETDIIPVVEPLTKYAVMLDNAEQVVYEVEKALYMAFEGRQGPVWIDVPLDIQNIRIDPDELEGYLPIEKKQDDLSSQPVEDVVQALNDAQRPVVLIGSGVRAAGAVNALRAFIENVRIPLVYSGSAVDTYGTANELSIGSVGMMGCSRAGNFCLQNADLVLVLGNRLSPMTTGPDYCKFARQAKTIVVDIDPVEHSKNTVTIDQLITSDVSDFLKHLNTAKIHACDESWTEQCLHWKKLFIKPPFPMEKDAAVDLYDLADTLSDHLDDNAQLVTDSGLIELILPTNTSFSDRMRCIHPASQGSMGYALPASIGVSLAGDVPVYAVIGDGSVMMNLQELETIRCNQLPVKIIVINNNIYAIIRKRQVDLFRRRTIGTDSSNGLSCPDFSKVADTFGLGYMKIETAADLQNGFKKLQAAEGPMLCEIMGLEDQDYLSIGYAKNSQGSYVQRPLEDQQPFLDRELFLSEMLIEPIDQ